MDNPFKKRATEYVAEPNTLLPLVSHAPLVEFFTQDGTELLEKLSIVVGTPGCGKTTIARIIEFDSLATLARDPVEINKELAIALAQLKILRDGAPSLLAYRLPMTTNFRSIWICPIRTLFGQRFCGPMCSPRQCWGGLGNSKASRK